MLSGDPELEYFDPEELETDSEYTPYTPRPVQGGNQDFELKTSGTKPHESVEDKVEPHVIKMDQIQIHYSQLDLKYRADTDEQFNISFTLLENHHYPTGFVILRDAREAKKLGDTTINQCRINANNMLLRVLGRLRSIDYVLWCHEREAQNAYTIARATLKREFENLEREAYDLERKLLEETANIDAALHQKKLDKMETNFNTDQLCHQLMQTNLSEGCSTAKDFEKLLFHYRNLSSVLDTAKSLVTVTYDAINNVLQRRTEDPVTIKLKKQQEQIRNEMTEVTIFPSEEQKTFHTIQKKAEQIANYCFAPLIEHNTRLLGSQNRKKFLRTLRNTWLTTVEVIFLNESQTIYNLLHLKAEPKHTWRFMRSGTLTYIGEGESYDRVREATRDNVEQARAFAFNRLKEEKVLSCDTNIEEMGIHFLSLVTDGISLIDKNRQKVMADHTRSVTEEDKNSKDCFTLVSTNAEGLTHRVDLSKKIQQIMTFDTGDSALERKINNKNERIEQAAAIILAHLKQQQRTPHFFSILLLWCASGQDRTGTLAEFVIHLLISESYRAANIPTGFDVESVSIASRHTAVLTAFLVGGSEGAKWDSCAPGLFSNASDNMLYLKSADTNKKNKVKKKKINEMLKVSSELAKTNYMTLKNALDGLTLQYTSDILAKACSAQKNEKLPDECLLVSAAQRVTIQAPQAPDEKIIKPTELYIWTEALQLVFNFLSANTPYLQKPRLERNECLRLHQIQKKLKYCSNAKKMAAELLDFIFKKTKFELQKNLSNYFTEEERVLAGIANQIYLNQPEGAKQITVKDFGSVIEGLLITSDFIKGFDHYVRQFGNRLAGIMFDKDILRMQHLHKKLIKGGSLKKLAGLIGEFVGYVLILGAISVAGLFVMAVPPAASTLVALAIAIKALAALHAYWFSATWVGSLMVGAASLFFGGRAVNQVNAAASLASNFNAVEKSASSLKPTLP